jgi:hypothetical protein
MPRGRPKQNAATAQGGGSAPKRAGRVNKMECVRLAIGTLGKHATPKQLQAHLDEKYGVKMDTKMLSTYKGSILKAARKHGGTRRAGVSPAATNGGVSVEDIRAIKALVDRIGRESLRQLAEVLSK